MDDREIVQGEIVNGPPPRRPKRPGGVPETVGIGCAWLIVIFFVSLLLAMTVAIWKWVL